MTRPSPPRNVDRPGRIAAALAYAAAGWPCSRRALMTHRAPAAGMPVQGPVAARRGCHDATTDPDVIRAWWRRWPHANVAIATGAQGPTSWTST